jgi:hypothetical protein
LAGSKGCNTAGIRCTGGPPRRRYQKLYGLEGSRVHLSADASGNASRCPTRSDWPAEIRRARGPISADFPGVCLERAKGFEPSTPTLARSCSTPELHPHPLGSRPHGRQVASYAKRRGALQPQQKARIANGEERHTKLFLLFAICYSPFCPCRSSYFLDGPSFGGSLEPCGTSGRLVSRQPLINVSNAAAL